MGRVVAIWHHCFYNLCFSFRFSQTNAHVEDAENEDEYMCMEKCYESYVKMGSSSPQYVVPDAKKHVEEDEQLYEDMDGAKSERKS